MYIHTNVRVPKKWYCWEDCHIHCLLNSSDSKNRLCPPNLSPSFFLTGPIGNSGLILHLCNLWGLYLKQGMNHSICDRQMGESEPPAAALPCHKDAPPHSLHTQVCHQPCPCKSCFHHIDVAYSLPTYANNKPGLKHQILWFSPIPI